MPGPRRQHQFPLEEEEDFSEDDQPVLHHKPTARQVAKRAQRPSRRSCSLSAFSEDAGEAHDLAGHSEDDAQAGREASSNPPSDFPTPLKNAYARYVGRQRSENCQAACGLPTCKAAVRADMLAGYMLLRQKPGMALLSG